MDSATRNEHDLLGHLEIPEGSLTGIHTARARRNFSISSHAVSPSLIRALCQVKQACAEANLELGFLPQREGQAIISAAREGTQGAFDAVVDLDALQGGAGTSTNMCVNEILANRALEMLGASKGDYAQVHPIHHVNLHQSTNDVYPTAVHVAGISWLRRLSEHVAGLQKALQGREQAFADVPTMGRTEWQPAVPVTLGRQFSAFASAISRDRWRTFKCEERLRVVNLGGTAVGTGLTAPRSYIFLVIDRLRALTGFGLSRAENLMGQTAHADAVVEVSGILNALATNLLKLCGDLRMLHFTGEIRLPAVQAGSSIMPGKVNPVILECAMQAALKAISNDAMIGQCASRASQQIVEFMPLLSYAFLDSLELLTNTCVMLAEHVQGIDCDARACRQYLGRDTAVITALLPALGYDEATRLVHEFRETGSGDVVAWLRQKLDPETVDRALSPEALNALGHR